MCTEDEDCIGLSDTCTSEKCTCGVSPKCSVETSDACDSGTCRCGINDECEDGSLCTSGVCNGT